MTKVMWHVLRHTHKKTESCVALPSNFFSFTACSKGINIYFEGSLIILENKG